MQFLNSLMINATRFLGEGVPEGKFDWDGNYVDNKLQFLQQICNVLKDLLWPILIVVSTVGCIWAIWLGIKMAKADEASKREEARKNVINTVAAMAVVIILILIIQLVVIKNLPVWLGN